MYIQLLFEKSFSVVHI